VSTQSPETTPRGRLSTTQMYNPSTGSWRSVASLTSALDNFGAASGPCDFSIATTCIYAVGGNTSTGTQAAAQMLALPAQATASFTQAGSLDGSPVEQSSGANQVDLSWTAGTCTANIQTPPVTLLWTAGGQVAGVSIFAPCNADDLKVSFNPLGTITSAAWVGPTGILAALQPTVHAGPNGQTANLYLPAGSSFISAAWSRNAATPVNIPLPSSADGAEVSG